MKKLVAWAIVLTMVCFTMCGCGSSNNGDVNNDKSNNGDVNNDKSNNGDNNDKKEQFSVRNGIMFGMTKDEVIEIDTNNDSGKYENEKDIDGNIKNNQIYYMPKSVAGIDNGQVNYNFDNGGKLNKIEYYWRSKWLPNDSDSKLKSIGDEYNEHFSTINDVMKSKYKTVGRIDGNTLTGINIDRINEEVKFPNDDVEIVGYNQYLANDGDNYVVIICECYKWTDYNPFSSTKLLAGIDYYLRIKYIPISQNELDNIEKASKAKEEQRNTDL